MKIEVENINVPGHITRVDAQKYQDMKAAMLSVLPAYPPGLNAAQILEKVKPRLPADTYPQGKASGWWAKTVQLDLEAKGRIKRVLSRPLTWYRTPTV